MMKSVITPCINCGGKIEFAADQERVKSPCPHCKVEWEWANPYYHHLISLNEAAQSNPEISPLSNASTNILKRATLEVRTSEELIQALKSNADEILVLNEELVTRLRAVKYIKSLGPWAVAAVIAAIPLIVATGGAGGLALGLTAPTAITMTTSIATLCLAIGGAVVISIFTDWEEVEFAGVLKLKRKLK